MSNRLTKIYTRTGDNGTTELSNHKRVNKSDDRIEAMGDIDELNSIIGFLRTNDIPDDLSEHLLIFSIDYLISEGSWPFLIIE